VSIKELAKSLRLRPALDNASPFLMGRGMALRWGADWYIVLVARAVKNPWHSSCHRLQSSTCQISARYSISWSRSADVSARNSML